MPAKIFQWIFTPRGLRVAVPLAMLSFLACGLAFSVAEKEQDLSAWDGVWWAFSTVTTVGYGDITPETDAGRVFAMFLMFTGIGFLLLMTGALIEHFVRAEIDQDVEEIVRPEREILRRLDSVAEQMTDVNARIARLERRGSAEAD